MRAPLPSLASSAPDRCFDNVDYDLINSSLLATNWTQMFTGCVDVDEMYDTLVDYLNFLVKLHVPRKRSGIRFQISAHVARLQKLISECVTTDTSRMLTLQKRPRKSLYRQRVLLERGIAKSRDSSRFYDYVSSKLKNRDNLSTLIHGNGTRISDDLQKAELLYEIFEENC